MNTKSGNQSDQDNRRDLKTNQATWADFPMALASSVIRTTRRFIKNIVPYSKNRFKRWQNEKNRLPKRTTRNRAYLLVGYTTKENIDKRYRAMKQQNMIRMVLLISILILTVYLTYKWLNPFGNTDEIKQIAGINGIEELTKDDPFSKNQLPDNVYVNKTSETTGPTQVTITSDTNP